MTQIPGGFAALGLHPSVLAATSAVGYEEPSPIQEQAIPVILAGHDMIGQAQTGTGKTAAFALPILSKIDPSKREPQALILAPTRELALQVATAFETYAKQMPGLNVVAVYGGAPMGPQLAAIRKGAQVIVATPGRLVDHLSRNGQVLSTIRFLVLDEADEMLKLGFMDDLEVIFEAMPAKTQTVEAITQAFLMVHADQKVAAVTRLLEVEDFDALIAFVRTKQATLDLASALEMKGYKVAALNGDIAQNQRERVIDSLKDGRLDIVVATDVAARGLDVPRITHVLNVDMPYDPESYVHRIGRTGRAGREGRALLLVTPRERRMLQSVERVTGQKIAEIRLPDAKQVLDARIKKLTNSLAPLVAEAEASHGELLDRLIADIGCSPRALASALLRKATNGQSLTLAALEREQPLVPTVSAPRERSERSERSGSDSRPTRAPIPVTEGRARCRTALGTRDGIAAKNLLGAILNEGGLAREAIGRIQIREAFSLIELPEEGLDRLLAKLKDTRVAGKALKLRRYRED